MVEDKVWMVDEVEKLRNSGRDGGPRVLSCRDLS